MYSVILTYSPLNEAEKLITFIYTVPLEHFTASWKEQITALKTVLSAMNIAGQAGTRANGRSGVVARLRVGKFER